jgi:IS4 transposase
VLNGFIIDIGIRNYRDGGIEEAKAHITALKETVGERPVLIMFDRDYASLEFVGFLEKSGVKYLIRLHSTDYKAERARMKSKDEEVEVAYTKHRLRGLRKEAPLRAAELERRQSVRVRIINALFDNGESAALMTNLSEGGAEEIMQLYRKRWSIEQKYHSLKNKLKFESVTGKARVYVKQDFWAQMLAADTVRDLINATESRAAKRAKKKRLKYGIRINENIAVGLFKEQFIKLIMEEDDCRKDNMFRKLTADMERYIVPVRKLEGTPRKWKYFNKYK